MLFGPLQALNSAGSSAALEHCRRFTAGIRGTSEDEEKEDICERIGAIVDRIQEKIDMRKGQMKRLADEQAKVSQMADSASKLEGKLALLEEQKTEDEDRVKRMGKEKGEF